MDGQATTSTVAIYGLTHPHTEMYLETLEALDEVVGVVLVDEDEAARHAAQTQKLRARFDTLQPALDRPDVAHVLLALPNDRTPAALVQAIEAGKGVFTEKPAARSAAEFEPVLSALERRLVPFTIAYLNRWAPPIRQIRELYRAGAIGRLTSVELRMVTTQVRMRDPRSWLFRRESVGGGVVAWLGCHWLDALRYVTGDEITRVQAELATTSGEAIDVEDAAVVAFRTSSGAVGSLHPRLPPRGRQSWLPRRGPRHRHDPARHTRRRVLHRWPQRGTVAAGERCTPAGRAAARINSAHRLHLATAARLASTSFAPFCRPAPATRGQADATDALRLLEVLDAIYAAGASGHAVDVERREVEKPERTMIGSPPRSKNGPLPGFRRQHIAIADQLARAVAKDVVEAVDVGRGQADDRPGPGAPGSRRAGPLDGGPRSRDSTQSCSS